MVSAALNRPPAVLRAVSIKGLIAITVWGASFIATRIALEAVHPIALVTIRLAMGTALLALLVRLRGPTLLPQPRDRTIGILLGIVLTTHLLFQAYGLQYTSAINTGWIIGFIPVTVAIGAQLLGQQALRTRGWLGVAIGTAGVLLVTLKSPPNFAHARLGDLLQIATCFTWAIYTLTAAGPVQRNGALRMTGYGMGVATLITLAAALPTGFLTASPDWRIWAALGFLGLICSGVGYYLWFAAQREHGPSRVGALLFLEPFVTLITARLILSEPITINALGGGVIVLTGAWLVVHGADRPAKAGNRT